MASTYILIHKPRMQIVDRYEANEEDLQPADSARRYFETNFAYRQERDAYRVFVMLGNEPAWD
jgi:hypothetical protein